MFFQLQNSFFWLVCEFEDKTRPQSNLQTKSGGCNDCTIKNGEGNDSTIKGKTKRDDVIKALFVFKRKLNSLLAMETAMTVRSKEEMKRDDVIKTLFDFKRELNNLLAIKERLDNQFAVNARGVILSRNVFR